MPIFQLCNIFVEIFIYMKILGMGNALTDVLATLQSDTIIQEAGLLKGGMKLIDIERLEKLKQLFSTIHTSRACGGSAANAITGLTHLGIDTGFIGKVGRDDLGRFYEQDLLDNGIESHLQKGDASSGCAMTFISPDGERTFGTYLGAAADLSATDLSTEMFSGYDLLHIEGYLVQDPALIRKAVQLAPKPGVENLPRHGQLQRHQATARIFARASNRLRRHRICQRRRGARLYRPAPPRQAVEEIARNATSP